MALVPSLRSTSFNRTGIRPQRPLIATTCATNVPSRPDSRRRPRGTSNPSSPSAARPLAAPPNAAASSSSLDGAPDGASQPPAVEVDALNKAVNLSALGLAAAAAGGALFAADGNVWEVYNSAVASDPIGTKAVISGVVYTLGDLLAQTYEGRSAAHWDRARLLRSGLCGFLAHGPLSHLYYVALDSAFMHQTLIPTHSMAVPLAKVVIDQTVWSVFWNSLYYALLGAMKLESPALIISTIRASWFDLLKAGWRIWPLVHLVTYGLLPVQHRLLFVDAVELLWVSILSIYGQQQRQKLQAAGQAPVACPLPGTDGEGGDPAEEILRGLKTEHTIVFQDSEGHEVAVCPSNLARASSIDVRQ